MNQFYVPRSEISDTTIRVSGQEAHHILHVMRYAVGDEITVTDGIGGRYQAEIQKVWKDRLEARIIRYDRQPESGIRTLVIAFGAIKHRPRLEMAVEKAVELGATEIVIFRSRYTERSSIRLDRLEGMAISAMKQSLRTILPAVRLLNSLDEVLRQYSDLEIVIADENSTRKAGIPPEIRSRRRVLLLVGPEGGFSDDEYKLAENMGAVSISLGTGRLRTETAVIALLAQFLRN